MAEPEHIRVTYNDVHNLIKKAAERIAEFKPDVLIAIGEWIGPPAAARAHPNYFRIGGGYVLAMLTSKDVHMLMSIVEASFLHEFW